LSKFKICAKTAVITYRFDLDDLEDIVAKAGTTLRIEIPIKKTHPIPTADWSLAGKPVDDSRADSKVWWYYHKLYKTCQLWSQLSVKEFNLKVIL